MAWASAAALAAVLAPVLAAEGDLATCSAGAAPRRKAGSTKHSAATTVYYSDA